MSAAKRSIDEGPTPKRKRAYTGAVGGSGYRSTEGAGVWGDVDPAIVLRAVRQASGAGAGLLLGATRDGTNCAITLFYEDPRQAKGADSRVRFYPKNVEQLELLMEDIQMWAEDPAGLNGLRYFTDNM